MRAKVVRPAALGTISFAACILLCSAAGAAGDATGTGSSRATSSGGARLILAQNAGYTVQQTPEQPVSPINPGTLPGSTSAIGGSAAGTNPITGLPCNGSGSLSVSGAGGLPGTATPPPGLSTETLDQIPVGTPPVTSVYGSQSNLGPC